MSLAWSIGAAVCMEIKWGPYKENPDTSQADQSSFYS